MRRKVISVIAVATVWIGLIFGGRSAVADSWTKDFSGENLVGYWRFNEGVGSETAVDSSGNGHDGTLQGSVAWTNNVPPKDGKSWSLEFDGGNGYVEVPDAPGLDLTGDFTIELWINPHEIGEGQDILAKHQVHENTDGSWNFELGADGKLYFGVFASSVKMLWWNSPLPVGSWSHVAFTYSETDGIYTAYLNGAPDASGTDTFNLGDTSLPLRIGNQVNSDAWFHGNLDEIKIYNQVRTEDQIKADAGQPVAYWRFEEGSGSETVVDSSGNGHDGTIAGAGWDTDVAPANGGEYALNFDGLDDYVMVPRAGDLDITESITIEAWIKREGVWADSGRIVCKRHDVEGTGYALDVQVGTGKLRFHASGQESFVSSGEVPMEQWTHVAAVVDWANRRVRLYIDGVLDAEYEITNALVVADYDLCIGRQCDATSNYFQGILDEIKLFGYPRTPWQIALDADRDAIRLDSAVINQQDISNTKEIRVSSGAALTGTLSVTAYNAHDAGPIVPVAGTPNWKWGDKTSNSQVYTELDSWMPMGEQSYIYTLPEGLTAPTTPGTYYIGVFNAGVYNSAELMSCDGFTVNWDTCPPGTPDVADWDSSLWEQSVTGVLVMGLIFDRDGNAGPTAYGGAAVRVIVEGESTDRVVSIPDRRGGPGTTVEIPVEINDADGVGGFQLIVTFDPSVLEAAGVESGSLTAGWMIVPNLQVPGQITVAGIDSTLEGLGSGGGSLATLLFQVVGQPGDSTAITFTQCNLKDTEANEIPNYAVEGTFTVGVKGDLNNDNVVDISDVILCLRIAVGLDPVNLAGDMNDDGVVYISDVILILRKAVGLD